MRWQYNIEIMKEISKNGYIILKYTDGFWITFWDSGQQRRIKSRGPYKGHDEAGLDLEILNTKKGS